MRYGRITRGGAARILLETHEVENLYAPCDLVCVVLGVSTAQLDNRYCSAGGDVCLKPYYTFISSSTDLVSPCRNWGEDTVQFLDETGAALGPNHTLAALPPRGYRVAVLDETPATPTVHSYSIDPENDWAAGHLWVSNSSGTDVKVEIIDQVAAPEVILDSIILADGEDGYLDYSATTDTTPRIRTYWDNSGSWQGYRTGTLFVSTFLTKVQPIALFLYADGSGQHDYAQYYGMPWPHFTG